MLVVLMILSFIMFLVYSIIPFDRAVAEADTYKQSLKNNPNAPQLYAAKIEQLRRELGTDQNVFVRYLGWIGLGPINGKYNGILQGNFGYSYEYNRPVTDVLVRPMQNTVFINIFATILGLGITIPLGILCATKRGSRLDTGVQVATIVGYSIPSFIIAIVFIWVFAIKLGWFPVSGMKTPGSNYTGLQELQDRLYYMALPLIAMTFASLGGMTRYTRAAMSEALSLDCIRTARAKGLRERVVVYSHAFRNALLPLITISGTTMGALLGGAVAMEKVFVIPGLGTLVQDALNRNDAPLVIGAITLMAFTFMMIMLVVDLLYAAVDPRIRAKYSGGRGRKTQKKEAAGNG